MTSAEGYAGRLTPYDNKGELNLANEPDPALAILQKIRLLADRIRNSKNVVMHTGAGISTSAGINDFRGPNGVWTTSRKRKRNPSSKGFTITFESAVPTITHMVIKAMHDKRYVTYVVSQNVDNLHLRSGLPRSALSELHGNVFMEWCDTCQREYERETETETVGLTPGDRKCESCGDYLRDKALDWEDALPEMDLEKAREASANADFAIIIGTSCQMEPAGTLPFQGAGRTRRGVAIVNFSRTKFDHRIGLRVRSDCDTVFALLAMELGLELDLFRKWETVRLLVNSVGKKGLQCSVLHVKDGVAVKQIIRDVHGVSYRIVPENRMIDDKQGNQKDDKEWGSVKTEKGYVDLLEEESAENERTFRVEAKVKVDEGKNILIELPISRDGNKKVNKSVDQRIETKVFDSQKLAESLAEKAYKEAEKWGLGVDAKDEAERAKEEEDVWFCCGKRRGAAQCCICKTEVWGGPEKRGIHIERCVYERAKTKKKEETEVIVID